MQLERSLKVEMASCIAAAQARSVLAKTIRAFRGLIVQVRRTLVELGLEPAPIPSKPEGSIALWFAEVTGWIGSLRERPRQVLRTEGEHVVNLVGSLILTRMHCFAPNFPFAQIFERFGDDTDRRAAEETSRAAVARVVALLLQWVFCRAPGA
jgi:hypothetical protein